VFRPRRDWSLATWPAIAACRVANGLPQGDARCALGAVCLSPPYPPPARTNIRSVFLRALVNPHDRICGPRTILSDSIGCPMVSSIRSMLANSSTYESLTLGWRSGWTSTQVATPRSTRCPRFLAIYSGRESLGSVNDRRSRWPDGPRVDNRR
jgi:hypothetical protein